MFGFLIFWEVKRKKPPPEHAESDLSETKKEKGVCWSHFSCWLCYT